MVLNIGERIIMSILGMIFIDRFVGGLGPENIISTLLIVAGGVYVIINGLKLLKINEKLFGFVAIAIAAILLIDPAQNLFDGIGDLFSN